MDYNEYIENNTIRCEASYRGGGIEINCNDLFPYIAELAGNGNYCGMTAYQNYLGGGMLGSIQSSNNFAEEVREEDQSKLTELEKALKVYFHNLTNHEGDEWEEASFEDNQNRPSSAY